MKMSFEILGRNPVWPTRRERPQNNISRAKSNVTTTLGATPHSAAPRWTSLRFAAPRIQLDFAEHGVFMFL